MKTMFAQSGYLLLILAVIPAALLFVVRYRHLVSFLLPLVTRSEPDQSRSLRWTVTFRFVCFALAWVLLVCAAASPRWGTEMVATRQEGSSVMFVVDISRSMSVTDIVPDRLGFASRYAWLLADSLENSPCGVVLVKGTAVLAIPLTSDRRSVLDLLSSLSPSMLSSTGTGLAAGLTVALEAFPRQSAASRTIILLTDGEETSGSLVDAARAVRTEGVRLIVVGVGTALGGQLDAAPGADERQMHESRLREDVLREAVRAAGKDALYVAGAEPGSARRVLELARPSDGTVRKLVYSAKSVYRYFEFLLASVVCAIAGFLAGGLTWRKS